MNNIEKFKTMKAIAKLKTELSREVLSQNAKKAVGLNGAFGVEEAFSLGKILLQVFKTDKSDQ